MVRHPTEVRLKSDQFSFLDLAVVRYTLAPETDHRHYGSPPVIFPASALPVAELRSAALPGRYDNISNTSKENFNEDVTAHFFRFACHDTGGNPARLFAIQT